MTSTLDKLYAILRRDLLTAVRHRSGFVVTMIGVFTELAAFIFYRELSVRDFGRMVLSTSRFFWLGPASTPFS